MHFLLYSRPTSVTGRQLRDALGINGGTEFPGDAERPISLIRWGSTSRVRYRPSDNLLNSRGAVARATDKYGSMVAMRDSGVQIPRLFSVDEALVLREGFPILGRNVSHTQGRDIQFCIQRADVVRTMGMDPSPDFFTQYIPTDREFRVHVFGNEVIKISEKVLTNEDEFQLPWVRNFENGYTFRNLRHLIPVVQQNIEYQSIMAVQSLGLDFGAVDVVLGDDGRPYILEVNTGPSLSDNSLRSYAIAIANAIGIPEDTINLPQEEEEEVMDVEFDDEELEAMAV